MGAWLLLNFIVLLHGFTWSRPGGTDYGMWARGIQGSKQLDIVSI